MAYPARRIIFVVPSDAHLDTGGVRIRYDRMRGPLSIFNVSVDICSLSTLLTEVRVSPGDIVVFSKVYSLLTPLLVAKLQERGHLVGIDLFDNYFSDDSDSRLTRFREWLRRVSCRVNFVIYSTSELKNTVSPLGPAVPDILLPDVVTDVDINRIAAVADTKLARRLSDRFLNIVWFGNGSNPFFVAGLNDLAAFSDQLCFLESCGWRVGLTILTNGTSIDSVIGARLGRLSVDWTLKEWSVEAEVESLTDADFCFLPVNFQPFSRSKTLNRALAAITSGCQVFSAGYELYDPLRPLIYTDASEMVHDLTHGRAKIGSSSKHAILDHLSAYADPYGVAMDLAHFFDRLITERPFAATSVYAVNPPLLLVDGIQSDPDLIATATYLGGISVRSPTVAKIKFKFDVEFNSTAKRPYPEVWIRSEVRDRMSKDWAQRLEVRDNSSHWRVGDAYLGELFNEDAVRLFTGGIAENIAGHLRISEAVSKCLSVLFPDLRSIQIERSSLHFPISGTTRENDSND